MFSKSRQISLQESRVSGPETLASIPGCDQEPAISRVVGLGDGSVILRENEKNILLAANGTRVELTGELHQPLFGSPSFVCIEDGCRLVRRRFDCDSGKIVEESALDLGRGAGDAGLTHLVSCADALTLGIVHNNNLALLRFNDSGDLEVKHSTPIDGKIIGVVARENDVVAATYEKATEVDMTTGFGRESEIRLHSSHDGKLIGTLKLEGDFQAGDGTLDGLIAFSGNGKMLAYTVDDGAYPQICVSTIPEVGSKSAPQEVWRGEYPDQARVDAMAFDASGGKLAISSTDAESILQVVTFDYNGQQQGVRSIETNETTTIVFDHNGNLLVVQVEWNEIEQANDTTLLLRFTEPKAPNNLSLGQNIGLPKIEPES